MHILQSTMFGNACGAPDGTEIGTYIVHYADRTEERIPIIYGKDVRDWWRCSDPERPSRPKSRGPARTPPPAKPTRSASSRLIGLTPTRTRR